MSSSNGGGYFSNQQLFMQPEVTQHNSHMVMTGVKKPHKTKRLNVDTRFCDDYNVNTNSLLPTPQPVANFNLTLPERVNEIRSMRVTHMELPMSYYNISDSLGNNSFVLSSSANATTTAGVTIIVPNNNYTAATDLIAAINTAINATGSPFANNVVFSVTNTSFCTITNNTGLPITVTFGSLPQGKSVPCSDRYSLLNAVQSLVPTNVALNDLTAANPNLNRQNITMRPEDFYTSSQRTARQAAAAQCLKQAPIATTVSTPSTTVAVNTTNTNSNLNQNIQDMDVLPFRLGWLLGFRATTLARLSTTVSTATSVTGQAFIDINGPRYLYLVVDEFLNGNPHTFTTMLKTSQIKNNVLARIAVNQAATQLGGNFGKIMTANERNGLLVSDTRTYSNKVNLQRLNVQLVNELGVPMNLNGLDFSFCLEMEFE